MEQYRDKIGWTAIPPSALSLLATNMTALACPVAYWDLPEHAPGVGALCIDADFWGPPKSSLNQNRDRRRI